MKVLITGGLGFIGLRLCSALALHDTEMMVIDNLHPQVHANRRAVASLRPSVSLIETDVGSPEAGRAAAGFRPNVWVHLAAETGTAQSLLESRRHATVNVLGTAAIQDALSSVKHVPDRIVLASSRAVYGDGRWKGSEDGTPFYVRPRTVQMLNRRTWLPVGVSGQNAVLPIAHNSDTEPRPTNIYAATKLAQEHLLQAWCGGFDSPLSIVRLQNVFGAGQALTNPYTGVLTQMARQAILGQPVSIYEGGGIIRDFVHVSDVVDALITAVFEIGGKDLRVDIGGGRPVSLFEVASKICALAGGPTPIATDKFRFGDVRAAFADTRAAEKRLNFFPSTTLDDGLKELIAWTRSELENV